MSAPSADSPSPPLPTSGDPRALAKPKQATNEERQKLLHQRCRASEAASIHIRPAFPPRSPSRRLASKQPCPPQEKRHEYEEQARGSLASSREPAKSPRALHACSSLALSPPAKGRSASQIAEARQEGKKQDRERFASTPGRAKASQARPACPCLIVASSASISAPGDWAQWEGGQSRFGTSSPRRLYWRLSVRKSASVPSPARSFLLLLAARLTPS